ncbi:MAG: extracellular solute-binding protein [Spirochaetales bacterium]|nr:extracellular solute-binding protein [Spirochaetales bacterium]
MNKFKLITVILVLIMVVPMAFSGGQKDSGDQVELTLGSWRTDDVAQINALLDAFSEEYPNIKVIFQPTNPPDYNATLRLQLESETGPDLMYARSYATGVQLYEDGYFADLSGLKTMNTSYSAGAKAPWSTDNGTPFAVPFVAVSHGIYYNKDIFSKLGLSIPETWAEFMSVCEKIKDAKIIPIANSLGDEWDIAEVVFMSLAPNYIGGMEGRLAYESGDRPWNDKAMVAAFAAMGDLEPYLPGGYQALSYNDSNALFATGQAAMYFDGSWSIGTFKDVDFEWSVFAVPPPSGQPGYVCFHVDAGMAMNAATEHPEEAKIFLEWLGSAKGAETLANTLPTGFFPMSNKSVTISDPHANAFLAMNNGRGTDVRLPWPKLFGGSPSGYELMMYGSIKVITGESTPQEAADALAEGLATWY